ARALPPPPSCVKVALFLASRAEGLMLPDFKNEALTDFNDPKNVQAMEAAFSKVESEFGRQYDLVIGGEHVKTADKRPSLDPGKPDRYVGYQSMASMDQVDRCLDAATEAFHRWRRVNPETRARVLFKTAAIMRRRKLELAA